MIGDIFVVALLILAVYWAIKHKKTVKSWFSKAKADVKGTGSSTSTATASDSSATGTTTTPPSNAPPAA